MRQTHPSPQVEAWRASYQAARSQGGPDCIEADDLVDLVVGRLTEGRRETLADHIVGCARCAREHRMLLAVHQEASGTLRLSTSGVWVRRFAVAAGLAAIALSGLLLLNPSAGPDLEGWAPTTDVRSDGRPSLALKVQPEDGARLEAPPTFLDWDEHVGTGPFRVHLADAASTAVWRSEALQVPRLDLPTDVLDRLESGRLYYWSVELPGSGQRRLGPFAFQFQGKR